MADTLRRTLELEVPPSQVEAQLRAQLDPQLALEVASPRELVALQVSGARVRVQVEPAGEGARVILDDVSPASAPRWPLLLAGLGLAGVVGVLASSVQLAALCLAVTVTLTAVGVVRTSLREERRGHEFAELAGAIERALRPMLSSGTGIPYRALPAGEAAAPAPRAAERVEFSPAWDRRVPAPAEVVTAHLRERLGIPSLLWVEAATDGWLAVNLQLEGKANELLVAVRPRGDDCTLEVGFRHGAGIALSAAWLFIVIGGSAAIGRFGLVTAGVFAVGALIWIGVAAAASEASRRHLLGTMTRRIEQVLVTLPDPKLQGSSDRALGTGLKGQGGSDRSDG